jgi:hypothetical protein
MPGRKAEQYKRTRKEKAAPGGEGEAPATSPDPSPPKRLQPKQGEPQSQGAKEEAAAQSQEQRLPSPKSQSQPQRSAAPERLQPGRPGKRAGPPASPDRRDPPIRCKLRTGGQRPSAQSQSAQSRPRRPAGRGTQKRSPGPGDRCHPRIPPKSESKEI